MQTAPLTQGLGHFVANPPFHAVPNDLLALLRTAFVDTVACLFSGRSEAVTQAALALVRERGSRPQLPVLMGWKAGAECFSVADVALVHAVAAHALDYDDMALNGHPSVVLVPALLAVGQSLGSTDAAVLRAYVVGYEVWAELGQREPDSLHSKGWHPTSVIGTVAVAAAVANLYGVTAEVASHALGIAASQASGLMGNFGSMTKPLHAGWAAARGIEAVRLAMLGVTASAQVLESPVGFLAALSPKGQADRSPWQAPTQLRMRSNGLSIKKYPVCYAGHRLIDGVIALRRQHGFTAAQVQCITATLSDVTAGVLHAHQPQTGLQAKFSAEFACAMAAAEGAVGLPQVTDAMAQRADIQALMARVQVETVAPGCPIEAGFALHDRVRITLSDGQVLDSGPIRFAKGHAMDPLEPQAIEAKWWGCLAAEPDAQDRSSGIYATLLAQLQTMAAHPDQSVCQWLAAPFSVSEGAAAARAHQTFLDINPSQGVPA